MRNYSFALKLACGAALLGATSAEALESKSKITVAETQTAEKVTGEAEGVIKGVDAEAHKARIEHGPITGTLAMPGMAMAFRVAPTIDLSAVKPGDKVKFTVTRDEKGLFLIEKMTPAK